ncbi:MAG: hypothetical protein HFJ74_09365 [Eggerthellaceae bacterium]|nr:hypothetical protein [Eggerthellaceae bacterium]
MDEKTEKIIAAVAEDVAVAEESGPAEARKPRRRAACAGGAAALAAVAVAVALMMQPAEAVEVEGFAARALIPHIPIESPWAAGGASVPGDEALADTGEAEAAEGEGGEQADAPAAPATEDTGAGAAAQPQQGASQAVASGSPAQAAPQGGSSSGSAAQPQQQAPAASQPSVPAHEHNWQPVTEPQWVVDKAAWDEPKYENRERSICNGCGADITGDPWGHIEKAGRGSSCSGYHSAVNKVQVGTIHHDEVGHNETVTTGYKCSCGATK